MHVAVCDDNIADRKQLERLLGRESDRRTKEGEGLFIDSYGNEKALLSNPMQYDIFYVDICKTDHITGADIAKALCSLGVQVPIYMCCSDINYRLTELPENVFFLDKPIRTNELAASLDHAYEIKQNAVPLIELRDEKSTYYVTEPDIMYGTFSQKHVKIHLTDGRIISVASDLENLYYQWAHYETFMLPNTKVIINIRYLEKIGLLYVYTTDHHKFRILNSQKKLAKAMLNNLCSDSNLTN